MNQHDVDRLTDLASTLLDHFNILLIVIGTLIISRYLVIWYRNFRWSKRSIADRDSVRLFPAALARRYYAAVDGRCEKRKLLVFRCRGEANNADHWYPHSRGGQTTSDNLVALCRTCNLRKTAHLPGIFETKIIEHARKSYMPLDINPHISGRGPARPDTRSRI